MDQLQLLKKKTYAKILIKENEKRKGDNSSVENDFKKLETNADNKQQA